MASSNEKTVDLTVAIPPRKLGQVKRAICDHLNSLKSRYVPQIKGVLIAWSNLHILTDNGIIIDDQPYAFWKVRFTAITFEPEEGKLFKGKVHQIQKQYLIVKAMDFLTATVNIPESLAEDSVIQNLLVDQEIYFRLTYCFGGDYRGQLDEECIELTGSLAGQEMEVDAENIYDYAKDFEY